MTDRPSTSGELPIVVSAKRLSISWNALPYLMGGVVMVASNIWAVRQTIASKADETEITAMRVKIDSLSRLTNDNWYNNEHMGPTLTRVDDKMSAVMTYLCYTSSPDARRLLADNCRQ